MKKAILLLLLCGDCLASDLWITTGFLTKHLTHEAPYAQTHGYRENNHGIGVEYRSFAAGIFKNSMSETSHYLGYRWMPLHQGKWSAGIFGGLIDGYTVNDGNLFPIAVPTVSWEARHFGVNVIALPKMRSDMDALIAVQFKGRF